MPMTLAHGAVLCLTALSGRLWRIHNRAPVCNKYGPTTLVLAGVRKS